jgi:CheY-like chemotaxis protein
MMAMPNVLVVDDSPIDRVLIEGVLRKDARMRIRQAVSGADALTVLGELQPDIVITDLQMPEMDGLALVTAMRIHYPRVPVVLITAHGSEALAVQALEQGAASYVPKSQLAANLLTAVDQVLELARENRGHEALAQSMDYAEFRFRADNDFPTTDRLVELAQQLAGSIGVCDAAGQVRLGMALEEALRMAILRGNLEFDTASLSRLATRDDEAGAWLDQRRSTPPFCDRRAQVHLRISPEEAWFQIVHEGAPWKSMEENEKDLSQSLESPADRSLILIRAFMDDVCFGPDGKTLTLVKRKASD